MISSAGIGQALARAFPLDDPPFVAAFHVPEEDGMMFGIEVYRRKRLLGRLEWRWRARARNGEVIANSTEGYINRGDMDDELEAMRVGFAKAEIVEVEQ